MCDSPDVRLISITSTTSSSQPSSTQSTLPVTKSVDSSNSSSKVNVGAIAGPIVACVVLLMLLIAGLFWHRRRRRAIRPASVVAAPYAGDFSKPNVKIDEKSGQTILLPPNALQVQFYQGAGSSVSEAGMQSHSYSASSTTDSRAASTTQLPLFASPPGTQPPPNPQSQQPVDVDRIIELIAQKLQQALIFHFLKPLKFVSTICYLAHNVTCTSVHLYLSIL